MITDGIAVLYHTRILYHTRMAHTIRVWYVPYAYGTILYTIRVRYDHTRMVSSYHMRSTIILYVKIASRFEIELALTAIVSLSSGLAPFCLHACIFII